MKKTESFVFKNMDMYMRIIKRNGAFIKRILADIDINGYSFLRKHFYAVYDHQGNAEWVTAHNEGDTLKCFIFFSHGHPEKA